MRTPYSQAQQAPSCPNASGTLEKWAEGQTGPQQAQLGPSKPLIIFLVNENLRTSSQLHWEDPGSDVTVKEEGTEEKGAGAEQDFLPVCRERKSGHEISS